MTRSDSSADAHVVPDDGQRANQPCQTRRRPPGRLVPISDLHGARRRRRDVARRRRGVRRRCASAVGAADAGRRGAGCDLDGAACAPPPFGGQYLHLSLPGHPSDDWVPRGMGLRNDHGTRRPDRQSAHWLLRRHHSERGVWLGLQGHVGSASCSPRWCSPR